MGAPAEVVANARGRLERAKHPVFEVWTDCWDAWLLFRSLFGQWIYAGMAGVRVGLNWSSVDIALRRSGLRRKQQDQLFKDMQIMEEAAIVAERELAKKKDEA